MILPQLKNLNINTNLSGAVDIVLPFKIDNRSNGSNNKYNNTKLACYAHNM